MCKFFTEGQPRPNEVYSKYSNQECLYHWLQLKVPLIFMVQCDKVNRIQKLQAKMISKVLNKIIKLVI